MVRKNNRSATDKRQLKKILFCVLIIIYTAGLCAGCLYACKNGQKSILFSDTFLEGYETKTAKNMLLACSVRFLIKDIIMLLSIFVLKYSGVLKGLCAAVPFVFSLQEGYVYICLHNLNLKLFDLLLFFTVKDTAVSFILIIFCFVIIYDIICQKENPKKDFQKLMIYISGILCVYIVDITVKKMLII